MAEYIESVCRSCFHSYVCEQFNENRDSDNKQCHFFHDHFVPAADVVEVVRCKDCKYCEMCFPCKGYGLEAPPVYVCCLGHRNREVLPNDYCSLGAKNGEKSLLYADMEEIIDATD